MFKKEVKSKQNSSSESTKRALLFGGIVALAGMGVPLYGYFGVSAIAIIGTTVGVVAASTLYTYCLVEERQDGRNEGSTLIKTLQKAQNRQLRREKIKTAKKMNDKLAFKAAILEEASASEREKREDAVSDAFKKGTPLSAKEAFKLHVAEDIKRRDVAKGLIKGNKRSSR